MSSNKKALGRGLGALLSDPSTDITDNTLPGEPAKIVGNVAKIPISQIETNPFQPRTEFEKEALLELSNSIKELGIIQPITVRKMGYERYQLISGERRFRASQLAGLNELPAYIRIANDQAMLEMALVENIQREDLNAIEVALSYNRLVEECNLTQEELGDRVGKKRSTVTNYLRLLKLPTVIQSGLIEKKISMGHARALLGINNERDQIKAYEQILSEGLSVRGIEEVSKSKSKTKKTPKQEETYEIQQIKEDLTSMFGAKIQLKQDNKGGGKVVIPFVSESDLKRILNILDL